MFFASIDYSKFHLFFEPNILKSLHSIAGSEFATHLYKLKIKMCNFTFRNIAQHHVSLQSVSINREKQVPLKVRLIGYLESSIMPSCHFYSLLTFSKVPLELQLF